MSLKCKRTRILPRNIQDTADLFQNIFSQTHAQKMKCLLQNSGVHNNILNYFSILICFFINSPRYGYFQNNRWRQSRVAQTKYRCTPSKLFYNDLLFFDLVNILPVRLTYENLVRNWKVRTSSLIYVEIQI